MADANKLANGAPKTTSNRSTLPADSDFTDYMTSGWNLPELPLPPLSEVAQAAAKRRRLLAERLPGETFVIPAGAPKVRANDTDYPYRAQSAFTWLTGWAHETVPESVLVFEASKPEDAKLYFRPAAPRTSREFYANPAIGEFWTGPRPTLAHIASELGIATYDLEELPEAYGSEDIKPEVLEAVSELRLVKDDYEIRELRAAIASTKLGFDDVIESLPTAIKSRRGERVIEGAFANRARLEDNTVGYDTIAAAGSHACILHWTKNDGAIRPGELLLLDAGVERESYYTADITRTLPISGKFTADQKMVYEAVLEAADAAFKVVRPGITFNEVHAAAMEVIAAKVAEWGLIPVSAEESLTGLQYHRRYMVHGTSHHLGLDVHDCAQARREFYHDGEVKEGMVFTIEPGLYFQPDDTTVPENLRGIGVRIEDDILVTANGAENLSVGIPRTVAEVEEWLAS